MSRRGGALEGLRVLEMAGTAPGPFACMMLADQGAEVLRLDRADRVMDSPRTPVDPLARSRRSVAVDLKTPEGVELVKRLAGEADVIVEGFRPGVMERSGLGPEVLLELNPRLVYARMTGFGQHGPMAPRAGHDINYIAVAGALEPIGRRGERPQVPLNVLGDFGGGGMMLAFGILVALHERTTSGRGQVVDAAMVDGAALLTAFVHGLRAEGNWSSERGMNLLDGGAPFYDTYETADGKYMAVGALEGRFYAQLLEGLGIDPDDLPHRMSREGWDSMRERFAAEFRRRSRDEWTKVFADLDACVTPVLAPHEVAASPHARARNGFVDVDGVEQPAPAPRLSRTPAGPPSAPRSPGADTDRALADWGLAPEEIHALHQRSAIAGATAWDKLTEEQTA
jgi:alpha-methylacyl-CoA racemase